MKDRQCSRCGETVTAYTVEQLCASCYQDMYKRIISASVRRPPTMSGLTFRLRGLKRAKV